MIHAENLSKNFKVRKPSQRFIDFFAPQYTTNKAVDNVSFHINEGEMVGYIGPNGAGKSTTIKMLTGILTPTCGNITINGIVPQENRKEYVKNIGAMFGQKTQLWWDLPLYDSFLLLKDIYNIPDKVFKSNMELFCDVLEINKYMHSPVRQLSLGQRVRGDLAAVLLHNPKVIFLDEPTIGIDIVAKKKIRDFITEMNRQRNTTMLLTTHDIADIEKLCSRIIVINKGHVVYDGSLDDLRSCFGKERKLEVEFMKYYGDFALSGAELIKSESNKKVFSFSGEVSPSTLINYISKDHDIANLTIKEPEIEEIISRIYESGEIGDRK